MEPTELTPPADEAEQATIAQRTGDYRETLYTVDKHGRRKWVYPHIVKGFFYKRRTLVISLLILLYLTMPWIEIGGKQAVLLDIFNRKFVFFGSTFWATDTKFLVMILGALAFSLFFFTALLGRVWCGWACPETVFLEFVFRPIETLIEGSAAERKKLDASPWTLRKIRLKVTKLLIFAAIAWFLASTFLAYFLGRENLIHMISGSPFNNLSMFVLTLAMMGLVLFQFGWFREQFCTVVCPYARFQSVLLDSQSLLVGYDENRGEPRGKARAQEEKQLGDCVDCGLCVRVCPTGIDIRNGLQLECIQCASCADACDSVMVKIGRPTGLVRYDTEDGLKGHTRKLLRPRVIAYALILCVYATAFTYFISSRELSEFQIIRTASDAPFARLSETQLSNHLYTHLSNKSEELRTYTLAVLDNAAVQVIIPISPFPVQPEGLAKVPTFFNFPQSLLKDGKLPIVVEVRDNKGFVKTQKLTLLGPDITPSHDGQRTTNKLP